MGCAVGRARSSTAGCGSSAQTLGQVVSPDDAALALRGLRTLGVRLERETASALTIAEWLARPARSRARAVPDAARRARSRAVAARLHRRLRAVQLRPQGRRRRPPARASSTRSSCSASAISWGGYESLVDPVRPRAVRAARPLAAGRLEPGRPARGSAVDRARRPGRPDRATSSAALRRWQAVSSASCHDPQQRRAGQRPVGRHRTLDRLGFTVGDTRISVWTRAGRDRRHRPALSCWRGSAIRARLLDSRAGSPALDPAQRLLGAEAGLDRRSGSIAVPARRSTSSAST